MSSASPMVAATVTGPSPSATWAQSRYLSLVSILRSSGLQRPEEVALALLAHYAIETGWGTHERQFNVAGIKDGPSWQGAAQVYPDGLRYRAYASIEQGLSDAVALAASPRYAASWAILAHVGDPAAWYNQVMLDGWHPWSETALTTYRGVYPRLRAMLALSTVPPAPSTDSAPTNRAGAIVAGATVAAVGLAALVLYLSRNR